jgi:multidrug efflux pump subunit AcrA (membrane-fusion protein)
LRRMTEDWFETHPGRAANGLSDWSYSAFLVPIFDPSDPVAVPASPVIDSGSRQVVIVDLGDSRFEPRDVKLGRRGTDYVEIREGIHDGDIVVVNGNFLIDAESNLQSALKALTAPPKKETSK